MADLPNGPLPDVSALKPRVQAILEEAGVTITMNDLCERLEAEYNINMKSHVGALKVLIYDVMNGPAMRVAPVRLAPAKRTNNKRGKAKRALKPAMFAHDIFRNERRPAIVEGIRTRGEMASAADIDDQISKLWRDESERERDRYDALAQKNRERYADEKATFDKKALFGVTRGGAAKATKKRTVRCQWASLFTAVVGCHLRATKKWTATPTKRAVHFEDAAQPPPAHNVVPSVSAAAATVYSCAVSYLRPFFIDVTGGYLIDSKMARRERTRWAALCLTAAGRGSLRVPTCAHALRMAGGETAGQALMRRALVLLGSGELQELQQLYTPELKGTCDFILSMLEEEARKQENRVSSCHGTLRVVAGSNRRGVP
jgi:hypothetical protein